MSGINYLADTNCYIYLLDENPLVLPFADGVWAYSFITEIELLSRKGQTLKEDAYIRKMLATCSKIGYTDEITDLTIRLRRKYSLKLPDAVIGASAQTMQIPLLTADRAFARVKEIDCFIIEL